MASTYSATKLEAAYAAGTRLFENEDFSNKDIRGRTLVEVTFVNCDFENSAIDHSILNGCKFIYCNFKFTRFDEADLSDCLIEECDFESTSFVCTNLIGTELVGVNTNEADFRGALFEEKCYVDTYGGIPVSGQISTKQEYLEASEATPDFCGTWREFKSRKEAQNFIDKHSGVDEEEDDPTPFQSWLWG